jgi:ferric-dicitrate binding protein FerR (iron transport regulator)
MQLKKLLKKWELTSLRIKAPFLEAQWEPRDEDKNAAWELYVELITRVATQRLDPNEGDDAAALKSIHDLFSLTRSTIKHNGRYCINFTRIAVVVLNQKVRPFTAKWHPRLMAGELSEEERNGFRAELQDLQKDLRNYTRLLADMAGVEDLTDLEAV